MDEAAGRVGGFARLIEVGSLRHRGRAYAPPGPARPVAITTRRRGGVGGHQAASARTGRAAHLHGARQPMLRDGATRRRRFTAPALSRWALPRGTAVSRSVARNRRRDYLRSAVASGERRARHRTAVPTNPQGDLPVHRRRWRLLLSTRRGTHRHRRGAAPSPQRQRGRRGSPLPLLLLLCQEIDGDGGVAWSGWGARRSCQMRRARWRLRQRRASRWVLPSAVLRAM
jgi:hypothetical protein